MILKILVLSIFIYAVTTAIQTCQYPCIDCDKNTDQCSKCDMGYFINNQRQCMSCVRNCMVCTNAQNCLICPLGTNYYKDRCQICSFGCLSCTHIQNKTSGQMRAPCSQCFVGYYQNQQSQCQACIPACNICQNTSFCSQCAQKMGYDTENNECVPCTENCTQCNGNNCTECQKGFYISRSGKRCIQCSENCVQCNKNGCQQCVTQFYVNNISQCQRCPSQCTICQQPTTCLVCSTGKYKTPENTCETCLDNCVYCQEEDTCDTCEYGYYYEDNKCNFCGEACSICSSEVNCTYCQGTFYLLDGHCQKCSENCVYCLSDDNCLLCTSYLSVLIDGMCTSCTDLQINCETCENQTKCLSCPDGYYLSNHECYANSGLGTGWIVLIVIFSLLFAIGLGMGIYYFWKNRPGYGILNGQNSGVRASYYEVP